MEQPRYTSFKEIDDRLKVLKLEKEIEMETIKLNVHQFKDHLSPKNIFRRITNRVPKFLLGLIGDKVLKKLPSKSI